MVMGLLYLIVVLIMLVRYYRFPFLSNGRNREEGEKNTNYDKFLRKIPSFHD